MQFAPDSGGDHGYHVSPARNKPQEGNSSMCARTSLRPRRFLESIVDHRDEGPAEWCDRAILRDLFLQGMRLLRDLPRQVIELRYGLNGYSYSLEETGRILRMTREYVRAVECTGLRRLRHILKGYAVRNLADHGPLC
jgi:RNA polymerase primary sigma factor